MTLAPFAFVLLTAFLASWAFAWPALGLLRFLPAARQTLVWAVYLGTLLCWLPLLACCLLLRNAQRDAFNGDIIHDTPITRDGFEYLRGKLRLRREA